MKNPAFAKKRYALTPGQWKLMEPILLELRASQPRTGRPANMDLRTFVEAVLFVARAGLPWRDMPERFGAWSTVYMRFRRWEADGTWQKLWEKLAEKGASHLLDVHIDSTSIPVHPHAAGMAKKGVQTKLWVALRAG